MRVPLINGWGAGSFALEDNFIRYVDILILGKDHIYGGMGLPFDPEGLLSTLPAVITLLSGYWLGEYLRKPIGHSKRITKLSVIGVIIFLLGSMLDLIEPINKQLWTISYVLTMNGLALMMLVIFYYIIDVKKLDIWIRPAIVFGSNPLVVFLGSGILERILDMVKTTDALGNIISVKERIYSEIFVPIVGELNGSLLFAIANIFLWLVILWYLYVKKIFVKI